MVLAVLPHLELLRSYVKTMATAPLGTILRSSVKAFLAFRSAPVRRNAFGASRSQTRDSYAIRFRSAFVERRSPAVLIHTRLRCAQNRSCSTLVDRLVFLRCSNLFSLRVHICSRSTPVGPNAFPMCSDALSLDACRSKCVSGVVRCALARRLSTQMRFVCAQVCSRSTPVNRFYIFCIMFVPFLSRS